MDGQTISRAVSRHTVCSLFTRRNHALSYMSSSNLCVIVVLNNLFERSRFEVHSLKIPKKLEISLCKTLRIFF